MSDMQIAIWFRRKTSTDRIVFALCQIFFYNLFNKIFGNRFLSHVVLLKYPFFQL